MPGSINGIHRQISCFKSMSSIVITKTLRSRNPPIVNELTCCNGHALFMRSFILEPNGGLEHSNSFPVEIDDSIFELSLLLAYI